MRFIPILRKEYIILFTTFLSTVSLAQQKDKLMAPLDQCIALAQKNGPKGKIAVNVFRSKVFSYRSFNAGLLPQITLSGTVPDYSRSIIPVVQPDGTTKYVAQSQSNSMLSLTLNQPILATGGSVFISSGLSRNDIVGDVSSTLWRSSPVVIGITQPLFQLNSLWWDNRLFELQNSEAGKKFNEDMEDAAIDATQKFFDVYIARMRVQNAAINKEINDTLLTISRGRYSVGKIDENDLLQSELALANAETDLSGAMLDERVALRSLAVAIGLEK